MVSGTGFTLAVVTPLLSRVIMSIGGVIFKSIRNKRKFFKACGDIEKEMDPFINKLEDEYSKAVYNSRLPAGMSMELHFNIPATPPSSELFNKYYADCFDDIPLESRAAFSAIKDSLVKIRDFNIDAPTLIRNKEWDKYRQSLRQLIVEYLYVHFFTGKFSRSRGKNVVIIQSPKKFTSFLLTTNEIDLDEHRLFEKYLKNKDVVTLSEEETLDEILEVMEKLKNGDD